MINRDEARKNLIAGFERLLTEYKEATDAEPIGVEIQMIEQGYGFRGWEYDGKIFVRNADIDFKT